MKVSKCQPATTRGTEADAKRRAGFTNAKTQAAGGNLAGSKRQSSGKRNTNMTSYNISLQFLQITYDNRLSYNKATALATLI
jgi:hypothetical protein